MSFWKWSRTAATNATADGSINWAEGMAPSAVNDSARAMMAAAAKYRDDVAGAITTSGSATAYTLTSYQVFDTLAHMDGAKISFIPHATNTGTVTLNVDGLGAKPLRPFPSVEFPAGCLVIGAPYVAKYNNSTAEWVVHSGTSKAVLGTTTNDNAATGLVGELVEASIASPGGTIATASATNLTTISLTAGDWDVQGWATIVSGSSANLTTLNVGVSTTSQTFGPDGSSSALTTPSQTNVQQSLASPIWRFSLSSTTTVYLVALSVHTGSANPSIFGHIRARRVR